MTWEPAPIQRFPDDINTMPGKYLAVDWLAVRRIPGKTREEGGFVLLAAGPLGIEGQQFLEGIGLRNAVRIEYPDPIIAVLQSKTKAAMDSAARPKVLGMPQDGCVPDRRLPS